MRLKGCAKVEECVGFFNCVMQAGKTVLGVCERRGQLAAKAQTEGEDKNARRVFVGPFTAVQERCWLDPEPELQAIKMWRTLYLFQLWPRWLRDANGDYDRFRTARRGIKLHLSRRSSHTNSILVV